VLAGYEVKFAADSLPEGSGFELPVPCAVQDRPKATIAGFGCKPPSPDNPQLLSTDITEGGPKRTPSAVIPNQTDVWPVVHAPMNVVAATTPLDIGWAIGAGPPR
jgi:hypothetical protein